MVEALEKAAEVVEAARSISRFSAELAARGEAPSCNWTYSESTGHWQGDCGIAFAVEAGSPAENGMAYCPKCGRKLVGGGSALLAGDAAALARAWHAFAYEWPGGPSEVDAALASRDAEIERLRHALELARPVMEAHAGPSRLAEFVAADPVLKMGSNAFQKAGES